MTAVGLNLNPALLTTQYPGPAIGPLNSGVNNTISNLIENDLLTASQINSGAIPAVRPGLISRISSSTANIATGARNAASSAVNSTISATRDAGNVIANDILPKPEPLSTTMMRNKLLSGILVGGFINGVKGMVKVINGQTTRDQALQSIFRDTTMGAIGGLSFAGGMGATASVLGRFMGGVPLSIAGLAIGTLATIGATEFVKAEVPAFADS